MGAPEGIRLVRYSPIYRRRAFLVLRSTALRPFGRVAHAIIGATVGLATGRTEIGTSADSEPQHHLQPSIDLGLELRTDASQATGDNGTLYRR
jgi:hypothetical protein